MGKKDKAQVPFEGLEALLEEIDQQIAKIDNHKVVRAAEKLLAKKQRLMAARRALLGTGSKLTGGSNNGRTTQAEVVEFMQRQDPGTRFGVDEIAQGLSVTPEVVRGHLNRGNGERFLTPERGVWVLRDPEKGFATVEDL
jgi:hypothetical protein